MNENSIRRYIDKLYGTVPRFPAMTTSARLPFGNVPCHGIIFC